MALEGAEVMEEDISRAERVKGTLGTVPTVQRRLRVQEKWRKLSH